MDNEVVGSQERTFLFKDEGYKTLGACFNVYKELGNGYLESVYQECLATEFCNEGVSYVQMPKLLINYKGKPITQYFVPDFLCYDKIIVELKAVKNISEEHRAQLFNYLKITGYKVGYIINFGHYPLVEHERFTK